MNVKSAIIAAAAALAILGGSAVVFLHQAGGQEPEDTPPATRQERKTRFLERVAEKLGIDVAVLDQAIKDARLEGIDEALAEGRINEEQAAKARERVNSGEGRGLLKERHHNHERQFKIRGGIIESAASAMNMTDDELKDELKAGKSIADVAGERGVALDDVKAKIVDAAKAKLDAAVANGRIDQPRADGVLQKLIASLDDALNKKREAPVPSP